MDMAYHSFNSYITNYNKGGPFVCLVGSHLGGARYFVVRDEITSLDQIKSLTVSESSLQSTEWLRFCDELGLDPDVTQYEGASMSQTDAMVALKSDAIDGIFVCDPYASIAEEEGFGQIIDTAWGSLSDELGIGWGECCTEVYNKDFVAAHPELTTRMVLAHCLATKFMYEHPYTAGLMFAEGFGTSESVGLRTMYLKTNAEGRTLNWEITSQNLQNLYDYQAYWGIDEEKRTQITNGDPEDFFDLSFLESCGIESFDEFLTESDIDSRFPVGMTYTDWLAEAEAVDGIDSESSTDGKDVEKWMDNEVITAIPLSAN
jgi:ABC-type nitrate/sulfonate/bicarbonate transport system substrate-binding protein